MTRIQCLIQSHIIWALLALHAVAGGMFVAMERHLFMEIGTGIAFAMSLGVATATLPVAWQIVTTRTDPERLGGDLLTVGIFLGWAAFALARAWSLYWRALGEPPGMLDEWVWAYGIFLNAVGGGFHLLSPGAIRGRVPPAEWVKVGAWVALGGFICAMALLYVAQH